MTVVAVRLIRQNMKSCFCRSLCHLVLKFVSYWTSTLVSNTYSNIQTMSENTDSKNEDRAFVFVILLVVLRSVDLRLFLSSLLLVGW